MLVTDQKDFLSPKKHLPNGPNPVTNQRIECDKLRMSCSATIFQPGYFKPQTNVGGGRSPYHVQISTPEQTISKKPMGRNGGAEAELENGSVTANLSGGKTTNVHIGKEKRKQSTPQLEATHGDTFYLSEYLVNGMLPVHINDWVPQCVAHNYEKAGVKELFEWQVRCLGVDSCSPLKGGNLVYSAPTSGGKTLVAEILAMRHILKERKVMFILPYVSIVMEKIQYFRKVWESLDLSILGFFCNTQGSSRETAASETSSFQDCNVAVCTIEKANVILNQLLKNDKLDTLGMIAIDEIHMFSDCQRGYLLEVMLSKILYKAHINARELVVSQRCENTSPNIGETFRVGKTGFTQIVGLSATMPNIQDLSNWFGGSMFVATERPVQLREQVYFAETGELYSSDKSNTDPPHVQAPHIIWKKSSPRMQQQHDQRTHRIHKIVASTPSLQQFRVERTIEKRPMHEDDQDIDGFLGLCADSLKDGHAVLLFCSKKKWCETSIARLTKALQICADKKKRKESSLARKEDGCLSSHTTENEVEKDIVSKRKAMILNLMEASQGCMCNTMRTAILQGLAYHHAGLTHEERHIVEEGFREGTIKFLAATTTLAAGVNMPVRRVIIRSPFSYMTNLLTKESYLQMSGRAGRKGQDNIGEAIIFASNISEFKASCDLLNKPLSPLKSCLSGDLEALKKMLLDAFSCGLVDSRNACKEFAGFTLCAQQMKALDTVEDICEMALKEMEESKFLKTTPRSENDPKCFTHTFPTSLGLAACESGLSVCAASQVFKDASAARKGVSLDTDLHLLLLLAPPYNNVLEPKWDLYHSIVATFESEERMRVVLTKMGISSKYISKVERSRSVCEKENPTKFRRHKRFFTALILHNLVEEVPLQTIINTFQIDRGTLDAQRHAASTFCRNAVHFMRRLNYNNLADLLEPYESRLCFGVVR